MVYEVMTGTVFQLLQNKDKWEDEDTKIQQSPYSLKQILESEGTILLIFLLVKQEQDTGAWHKCLSQNLAFKL